MIINRRESVISNIFLMIASLMVLLPALSVLNIALKTREDYLRHPTRIVQSPQFSNFTQAWISSDMGSYFMNSVIITVGVVAGISIVAVFASFPISRNHFTGSKYIYLLFLSSLFLPVGLVPLIFLMNRLNLMNTYQGLILLHIGNQLPISIFIFVGFIKSIPREIDEAAYMDGCGYYRYIVKIVVPLLKPAIATVGLLTAIGAWNDFVNAYIFLSDKSKRPLTAGLYMFVGQYSTNWTIMAAGVIIIAFPLIIIYLFAQRFIIAGVTSGAIKG